MGTIPNSLKNSGWNLIDKAPLVVVLGGLGFIGSHLSRALLNLGYRVRIFDKLYASNRLLKDIESRVEIVEGDSERPDDVINVLGEALICFHLIHTTVPGSSMQDPGYDVQSNVLSSVRWLSQLDGALLKRLIYISSGGTVYGLPQTSPINEDHPTNPVSSYGITKLSIEKYITLYASLYGIEYRIARPSNVYGEGQRLNINQGVIGVFANKAFRGEPIEVWGDGNIKRDYLYVADLVSALVALLHHDGPSRIFNISSGQGHSLLEIIGIMEEIIGNKIKTKFLPKRGFDIPVNVLSSKRLKDETGWVPKVGLYEGISRYVQWFRKTIL
ncbi:MAG: NAD-dependent epimerase/dehydratase family protein [Candidatus Aenigmarchaeota archaeon]|nr:NAD-dependent epimerase/dehydratase family protein [Candidatus Aenigmarchaeota archaeon]